MKTKLSILCLVLVSCASLFAHDFEVDGIYYKKLSDNSVAVSFQGNDYSWYQEYRGDIIIPETVTYNDITYRVTEIGYSAFHESSSQNPSLLTSITLPNSITKIGHSAFYNCSNLTSITIPNSVVSIGASAFYNCKNLTSISIGSGVTWIGEDAFMSCPITTPLYSDGIFVYMPKDYAGAYNIPEGIRIIHDKAFADCKGLTSITIPNSVTSIGQGAFRGCSNLSLVVSEAEIPPYLVEDIGVNSENSTYAYILTPFQTFRGAYLQPPTKPNAELIIPCSAYKAYATSAWCKDFAIAEQTMPALTLNSNDEALGIATIIQENDCNKPAIIQAIPTEGNAFVEWNDGNTDNPRTVDVTDDVTLTATFAAGTVTGITLPDSVVLELGESTNLQPTILPTYAVNKKVKWMTDDPDIAYVLPDGSVVATNYGRTTITATTEDGGHTAQCEVIVFKHVTGVEFEEKSMQMRLNTMQTLIQAKVLPEDANNKNVTYTSSNPSVLTINGNYMMAFALGTSTITATTEDGGYTAKCEVTVVENIATSQNSPSVETSDIEKVNEDGTVYIIKPTGEKYLVDGRKVE